LPPTTRLLPPPTPSPPADARSRPPPSGETIPPSATACSLPLSLTPLRFLLLSLLLRYKLPASLHSATLPKSQTSTHQNSPAPTAVLLPHHSSRHSPCSSPAAQCFRA